jgi:F0F1-type ATP synthase assembly protein I
MKNRKDRFSGEYLKFTGIGFEMVASVGLFCLIGYFVDRHWGISPIGLISGAIVGMVVGFYLIIKETLMIGGEMRKEETDEGGESEPGKKE